MNALDIIKQELTDNEEMVSCIANYLQSECSNLTNIELKQFVLLCKMYNLNPLKKQVYAIKYGSKFQIVVNYYEYVKRAEKTGLLDYYNVDVIYKEGGSIDKAVFTGKRKDWEKELVMVFPFNEWSKPQANWKEKPHFMIEKVALANGLRRLFPNEIAELPYIKEEDYISKDEPVKQPQFSQDAKAIEGVIINAKMKD